MKNLLIVASCMLVSLPALGQATVCTPIAGGGLYCFNPLTPGAAPAAPAAGLNGYNPGGMGQQLASPPPTSSGAGVGFAPGAPVPQTLPPPGPAQGAPGGLYPHGAGSGGYGVVTPVPGGAYGTYNSGTGQFGVIKPLPGGGVFVQ